MTRLPLVGFAVSREIHVPVPGLYSVVRTVTLPDARVWETSVPLLAPYRQATSIMEQWAGQWPRNVAYAPRTFDRYAVWFPRFDGIMEVESFRGFFHSPAFDNFHTALSYLNEIRLAHPAALMVGRNLVDAAPHRWYFVDTGGVASLVPPPHFKIDPDDLTW